MLPHLTLSSPSARVSPIFADLITSSRLERIYNHAVERAFLIFSLTFIMYLDKAVCGQFWFNAIGT